MLDNQFTFQHLHFRGRVLNVGCDSDSSNLKARGAVNFDFWNYNPYTKAHLPVDVIGDCRNLPFADGEFQTVLLGDILEHFIKEEDIYQTLREAWRVLTPGGTVVITCPCDTRSATGQGYKGNDGPMYCEGVRAYHAYPVHESTMRDWLASCGVPWEIFDVQHIRYPFTPHGGTGIAARKPMQAEEIRAEEAA